jgi:glyoxylase-like metal-dependent hydrolase (beta-lactamase superfamily II)
VQSLSTEDANDRTIVAPLHWWKALPRPSYANLHRLKSNQPWFELYEVDSNVYAFYEPGHFEEAISYPVVGGRKAALIDTGCGIGNVKMLTEEFTELPLMVVNTHSHYDHIAQNYMFQEVALFDAPNARQASRNGCSKAEMSSLLANGMLSKALPEHFDPQNYQVPPFAVTRWLKNGDIIDLGHRSLEVVHTPGHSPDSICLPERDAKLLWTGDIYYPSAIYVHLPGSDLADFINSYERMIALSPLYERLLPSHNETCIEKRRLEQVLEAAEDIRAGKAKYIEGIDRGTRVRKYQYADFAIITKVH